MSGMEWWEEKGEVGERGVVNCLCTGRGWNKVETWKNIYMDRRRPPPPAGKWKIAPPTGAEKCKLLLISCKIVQLWTIQNLTNIFSRFYQLQLPLYNKRCKSHVAHHALHNTRCIDGKQLLTDTVENPVENMLIIHSLWKTPCINIHHFCINIHPLHKYTFCTKIPTPPHYINSDIPSRPALYLTKTARYDKSRVKFTESSTIFEFASCNIISCNAENQLENLKTRIIPDRIRQSSWNINHIQTSRYARCRTSILHIIS